MPLFGAAQPISVGRRSSRLTRSGAVFAPGALPNLVGWWDASQITGLNDLDPVTTWADLSGGGRNLTQATAAAKPTYRTNIQNGKPAIRTDGVDDYLDYIAGADWITTTTLTAYFVMTKRSSVGNACMMSLWASGGEDFTPATGCQLGYFGTAGSNQNGDYRALGARSVLNADYGLTVHQTTHLFDGTNNTYWRDAVAATAAASAGSFAVRSARIGARGASLGGYFGADYHEILLYSTAHDATTRATVEAYLKAKWGTP